MKPIVLIHGAYHGGWCWKKVVEILQSQQAQVICPDLPGHGQSQLELTDLYGDGRFVRQLLEQCEQPPVLCGHSYGGAVITEAVNRSNLVDHMVYLAALVPDAEIDLSDDVPEMANALINAAIQFGEDGLASFDLEQAKHFFYADCNEADIVWATSRIDQQKVDTFIQNVTQSLWSKVNSSYVLCTEDNAVPMTVQKVFARRCGQQVILESSHSPMLSQPEKVADLLLALAR